MERKNTKFVGGLKPEAKDPRDLKTGALIDLPKLSELPDSFTFQPVSVKNQYDTDFCSAFATCSVSELQEGVELDPLFSFAASKKLSGDPEAWGQSMSYALKGHCKIGTISQKDAPFDLDNVDPDKVRDISNFPESLLLKAIEHRKKSYLEITGPYDTFDNVRATIWKFRNEKRAAVMGLFWNWNIYDYVLKGMSDRGYGHLVAIYGWTPEGLVILNSGGTGAGKAGFHILPREEANYYINTFNGAFMFLDLSPDEVSKMIEEGVKLDQFNRSYLAILQGFIRVLQSYVAILTKNLGEIIGSIFSKRN